MRRIPLVKYTFSHEDETRELLACFIRRGEQLSMGPWCARFEDEFAKWQDRRYAVLFNSGSSANLALLQALLNLERLTPHFRAAVSALTWATNVMPIMQLGGTPIPVDVTPRALNVVYSSLERVLEDGVVLHTDSPAEYPEVFFATNVLGLTGDMRAIRGLCARKSVLLLEDNCESLGTIVQDERAGNFGFASTFSFFVSHQLSTIEGGMVCTDDVHLTDMLKMVRAHGWDRNLRPEKQHTLRDRWSRDDWFAKFLFYNLAYNLRPTEITGFLGCQQLKYIDDDIMARQRNFAALADVVSTNAELLSIPELGLVHAGFNRLSSFAFPVLCATPELRSKYLVKFEQADIETRPIVAGNIVRQPFWPKLVTPWSYNLKGADFVERNGFYCGNYPGINVDAIAECLRP